MRRALVALVVAVAGCSGGPSLVVVTVATEQPLANVALLHTVSTAGGRSSVHDFTAGTSFALAPGAPMTFGVDVPASITGTFAVHVEARDPSEAVLAEGDDMTQLSPGHRSDLTVTLGESAHDGGVDLGATTGDGAADMASQILVIRPDHQDFGSLAEGSVSAEQSFKISNISASSAGILTVAIAGTGATQFQLSTDTCSSNPLFSMTFCNVGVTFHPALAGPRSATVTITSGTLGLIGTIPLTGIALGSQGRMCMHDSDCQTWTADAGAMLGGHCVDGFCCDVDPATCAGCRACNVSGKEGTCSPVPPATDPKSACTTGCYHLCNGSGACSPAAVGSDPNGFCTQACANKCDGSGACKPAAAGTPCGTAACQNSGTGHYQFDGASSGALVCDGSTLTCTKSGVCPSSLVCDTSTGHCKGSCANDIDCIYGYYCSSGQCIYGNVQIGQTCTSSMQCGEDSSNGADHMTCDGKCEGCIADTDCPGPYVCLTAPSTGGKACFYCSGSECQGSGWGNTCVAQGSSAYCGCTSSNDCISDRAPFCLTQSGSSFCGCTSALNGCIGNTKCVGSAGSASCAYRPGVTCTAGSQCASGSCVNGFCQ